jgi:hypothetical protein
VADDWEERDGALVRVFAFDPFPRYFDSELDLVVNAPQDRLAEWVVARRPALSERSAITVLANLGMSTQLALFGLFLALGRPLGFAWFAVGELAVVTLALIPQRAPVEEIA